MRVVEVDAASRTSPVPIVEEPLETRAESAPPHPAIAGIFAPYLSAGAGQRPSEPVRLPDADCRALSGMATGSLDHCDLHLLANGTAPCLVIAYDCGAHLCSVKRLVWHGADPHPYSADYDEQGVVEVSPDHRYLIVSYLSYEDTSEDMTVLTPESARTERIEFETGHREVIANCLSTVLSPRGRYYVCRDLEGNVLRFPVNGGPLELIAKARLLPDQRIKLGGAFDDYPEPVVFPSPSRMKYTIYVENDEQILEREAPFPE